MPATVAATKKTKYGQGKRSGTARRLQRAGPFLFCVKHPHFFAFYALRFAPNASPRHLCPMIIAKKNGRSFRFSDTIWETMSAAQKAEFSGVEKLAPAVRASNATPVPVPPEVVAMMAGQKHKNEAEAIAPTDEHGVIGRGEHEDDDPERTIGIGPQHIKKTRSKK